MRFLVVLLYGTPDAIVPIASALTAIVGLLLMLWNRLVSYIQKFSQLIRSRSRKLPPNHPPSSKRRVTVRDRRS